MKTRPSDREQSALPLDHSFRLCSLFLSCQNYEHIYPGPNKYLKSPVEMPDVVSGLVNGLEGSESGKEDILADEPRAIPTKGFLVGENFNVNLAIPVDDVMT